MKVHKNVVKLRKTSSSELRRRRTNEPRSSLSSTKFFNEDTFEFDLADLRDGDLGGLGGHEAG